MIRRLEGEPKTLNWVMTTTAGENYIMLHLYDPLVYWDQNLEYTNVLAESYEVSDDHLQITVHLRENIY